MADEQGQGQEPGQQQQGTGQEPGDGQQQGGTGQGSGGQQGQQGPDLSSLPEDVRTYLEKQQRDAAEARREAAKYRTDLRTAQGEVEKFRQATMTDEQRRQAEADALRKENETLKEQARTAGLQAAVTEQATALRFHSPRAALAMLDRSQIEYDDNGKPTNLRALLEKVAADEPYLVRRQGPGGGGEGRSRQAGASRGMNDLIRERMGR